MKKYLYVSILFALLLGYGKASGQNGINDMWLNPGTDDFATIQNNVNNYFAGKDHGRGSGYTQWKRWEFMASNRLTSEGKVTNWAARTWDEYNNYKAALASSDAGENDVPNGHWYSIGPTTFTNLAGWNPGIGRINSMAFHPSVANTFWVGTPAGGLWKTTNGGSSWTPLTDGMPVIGVSGIAVDYTNTNVLYILTGDGDAGDTKSIGVLKSTDGGETWMPTGLTWSIYDNVRGYKLLMHPTNHSILFAITRSDGALADAGIYKTVNGGQSWTQVKTSVAIQDIEFKPGDPTIMYASGGTQFFRSTSTGDTWTTISSGVPGGANRMAIGVTPANPAYVYILAGPSTGTGSFVGEFLSTNSGVDFFTRSTTPNILGYEFDGQDNKNQSWYDLATAVSRTDASKLMIGGINTWSSSNWGSTWTITSMWDSRVPGYGYTHADIHGLEINPLNNFLYCLSDGGIHRSTDFGATWTDLTPGIAITQWYRIAGVDNNSNLIIGGTQDNGSNMWTGGANMQHIQGADGGDCMIDFTNANILYASYNGALMKSVNAGVSFGYIGPTYDGLLAPFIMNPNDHLTIYGGYNNVWKSTNGGSTWTNTGISGSSAMAIGTSNSQRVYAASGSSIWMTSNGASTWTSVGAALPNYPITGIALDPNDSFNVFVTLGGFTAGQKVYHSTDAGTTWTNISGTLPNIPANCIAFENTAGAPSNAVYVGTDIGVFYRDDNHTDWIPFRNGLPTVPVFDLEINETAGLLTAGTFGRGLWRSSLYSTCAYGWSLTAGNDPSNPNNTGYQFYEASNYVLSSRTVTGGLGTDVLYKADNYVKLTTGFQAKEHNLFRAKLGPCNLGAPMTYKPIKIPGTFIQKNN
ncbi:MAG: hypothetical protein NT040_03750 [Bacteroidetes bacterium]|nr:hypothetical protein [Bacteroidota bacterium]